MSEPLTNAQLDVLVKYGGSVYGLEAAAEIRELRKQVDGLEAGQKSLADKIVLAASYAVGLHDALEMYGQHDEINCPQAGREQPMHLAAPCTCGLDNALKELGSEGKQGG